MSSDAERSHAEAILIVGTFTSRCSFCGGNANMHERYHIHGGPYSAYTPGSTLEDTNGCRAIFVRRESEYSFGTHDSGVADYVEPNINLPVDGVNDDSLEDTTNADPDSGEPTPIG